MSDAWRRKSYYDPRVLLDVDDLADPPLPDRIVFLTGPQIGIIQNLLQYARRRINWVAEYQETYYLAPTNAQWDTICAVVAEMEVSLMTGCCEDLVNALVAINSALGTINTTLTAHTTQLGGIITAMGAMDATIMDIVPPLECLCAKTERDQISIVVEPEWIDYPNATNYFEWSNAQPVTTVPALVDADACAMAQAWYQSGYEWMTEYVLPSIRFGFDKFLPAAAAGLHVITGGASLIPAIGVWTIAEICQELLEIGYDAAETNLENWIITHKQDIVCGLYDGLKGGGNGPALWLPIKEGLVDPSSDLSVGDKLIINVVMRYWGLGGANLARIQSSTWYSSIQTPGYCDLCTATPTIGSNWVAMPVASGDGNKVIDHPSGSYWQKVCWDQNVASGFTVCGMMIQVTRKDAGLSFKWMDAVIQGCAGAVGFTGNRSDTYPTVGWYYVYTLGSHNNTEAVATLAPGATSYSWGNNRTGPTTMSQAWTMGYTGTDHIEFTVTHIVYQGTTPPPFGY